MISETTEMRLYFIRNSIWVAGLHFYGVVKKTEVSDPLKDTIEFITSRPILIIAPRFILRYHTLTIIHRKMWSIFALLLAILHIDSI